MSVIWAFSLDPALADKRVALVLGNSAYLRVTKLPNPENDAADLAETLRGLNFDVIFRTNTDRRGLDSALEEFERKAAGADTALFFFAGHGLQYRGHNYLLPIDADLEDEVSLRYNTLAIDKVRDALDSASGVKIMILDACRNNPLSDKLVSRTASLTRSAELTRGLARLDRTEGMVVAYATQADQVAQDGSGRNSPFSSALVQRLREPNLEIATLFRRVAQDVYEQTGGKQRPELSISLLQDFYLNLRDDDSRVWRRLIAKPDVSEAELQEFAAKFPASPYVRDAQTKLYVMQTLRAGREAIAREKAEWEAQRQAIAERDKQREIEAQQEKERRDKEQAALERVAVERREKELADEKRREDERLAAQKHEQEKVEAARLAAEMREREQAEVKRLAAEKAEQDHLAAVKRAEAQREAERVAAEAREKARQEAERIAAERKAAEQLAKDENERKRLETARLAAEKKEQERAAAEQREAEKREADRLAEEKRIAERQEKERIRLAALETEARQKAEAEQARLKQAEVCARESADIGRLAAGKQKDALAALKPQISCPGLVASIDKAVGDMRKAQEQACFDEDRGYRKISQTDIPALKLFVARASCDSVKATAGERLTALETQAAQVAAACTRDGERLTSIRKEEDRNAALASLKDLQSALACEKLRPDVAEAIKLASTEPVKPVNTPDQIKSAQIELRRVGCFTGDPSGALDKPTKAALGSYFKAKHTEKNETVGDALLVNLRGETVAVCKPEPDVAAIPQPEHQPSAVKPAPSHPVVAHRKEDDEPVPHKRVEREAPAPRHVAAPAVPRVPAPVAHVAAPAGPTASSAPSRSSSAIGVGF